MFRGSPFSFPLKWLQYGLLKIMVAINISSYILCSTSDYRAHTNAPFYNQRRFFDFSCHNAKRLLNCICMQWHNSCFLNKCKSIHRNIIVSGQQNERLRPGGLIVIQLLLSAHLRPATQATFTRLTRGSIQQWQALVILTLVTVTTLLLVIAVLLHHTHSLPGM